MRLEPSARAADARRAQGGRKPVRHRDCIRPSEPDEPYPRVHAEWPEERTALWMQILAVSIETVRPPKLERDLEGDTNQDAA